jgi:hypothetical protein
MDVTRDSFRAALGAVEGVQEASVHACGDSGGSMT